MEYLAEYHFLRLAYKLLILTLDQLISECFHLSSFLQKMCQITLSLTHQITAYMKVIYV